MTLTSGRLFQSLFFHDHSVNISSFSNLYPQQYKYSDTAKYHPTSCIFDRQAIIGRIGSAIITLVTAVKAILWKSFMNTVSTTPDPISHNSLSESRYQNVEHLNLQVPAKYLQVLPVLLVSPSPAPSNEYQNLIN